MSKRRQKTVQRRPRQCPMLAVHDRCRSAVAVWAALRDMADALDTRCLTPTRQQLSNLSGVRDLDTISKALKVLHEAKWICKETVPVTDNGKITAKVLRIMIIRKPVSPKEIDAASNSTSYARLDTALPIPDSPGHRTPAQPGLAMPEQTGHESSFRRPANAASEKAAVGGEVPPSLSEPGNQSTENVNTPATGTPIGALLLDRAGLWAPEEQRALWERFEHATSLREPEGYTSAFQAVLRLLGLDDADVEAQRQLIEMVDGPDWATHLELLKASGSLRPLTVDPEETDRNGLPGSTQMGAISVKVTGATIDG